MSWGKSGRTIDISLCATPADPAHCLHFYSAPGVAGAAPCDVNREIVDAAWAQDKATAYTAASFIGDVMARLRAAARGELRDADNLEPVRLDPVLWEIKWRESSTRGHRMYHAEPGATGAGPAIVALRFHRKDTSSGDQATIDAMQEAEMEVASRRYVDGMKMKWGHRKPCTKCLDV